MSALQWEKIEDNSATVTTRLKVEGGWIVKSCTKHIATNDSKQAWTSSTCFVADPKQQWAINDTKNND